MDRAALQDARTAILGDRRRRRAGLRMRGPTGMPFAAPAAGTRHCPLRQQGATGDRCRNGENGKDWAGKKAPQSRKRKKVRTRPSCT